MQGSSFKDIQLRCCKVLHDFEAVQTPSSEAKEDEYGSIRAQLEMAGLEVCQEMETGGVEHSLLEALRHVERSEDGACALRYLGQLGT